MAAGELPSNRHNRSPDRPDSSVARAAGGVAMASHPPPSLHPMNTERPDPNAELYTREPLRVVFALLALALGLATALNF